MTPERWEQVKALFEAAVERAPHERTAFLDKACPSDAALRHEVESLLESDEEAEDFIEDPLYEIPSKLLPEAAVDPVVGRCIGPYKVLRPIGHGGMGAVFWAERADDEYQKQVAIKLVKRGMDSNAILRGFRNERQILARLDHPNIAKLLDGGTTEDGLSYFVMDYVDGVPIDAYCDTHKLSVNERLKLFRTVCSAVHYAHVHHIVHRDLKPSNILVTVEGVPKLLDFGIAKLLDPEHRSQTMGSMLGGRLMTPEYASPEQVRGETLTPASDVYSLGVLLYELLTGHRPYRIKAHTPQEIERVVCSQAPEKPSGVIRHVEEELHRDGTPKPVNRSWEGSPEQFRRRLTGDLDTIVLMALRKEPERRYASVEQFTEDIRRHMEGQPVIARKDTLWYRTAKFINRNKPAAMAVMLVGLVLLVLVAAGLHLLNRRGEGRTIDSIAILPFVNAGADPSTDYLSDGIAETITNSLSQLPKLRVVSSSATSRTKGRPSDAQKVGRDLQVGAVLTGKVDQRGDTLIINTELLDVTSGSQLWSQNYNRKLSDIFAVQEDISRGISEKLRLNLGVEERKQLTKRYTENTEVYQLYLKGRYFLDKREVEKGIKYFEQAMAKDPNYALAFSGLADCYIRLGANSTLSPKESFPRAKAVATRALAIDDRLAEAHSTLAVVKGFYEWDFSGAEREFQRALALNPGSVRAYTAYSQLLVALARAAEAIVKKKQAKVLDPLAIGLSLEWTFVMTSQYDQAIEECRKTLEMDPNFYPAYFNLGRAYEQKGMYEEAIAAFRRAVSLSRGRARMLACLGHAYARSGKKGEAQQILEELKALSKQRYVSPYYLAILCIGLGEKDQAFEWLYKAYEDRETMLVWLQTEPRWDSLRSDPRFADLVRRVGLPP